MSPMVALPLTIEHALLGFLYLEPMHGYEIYRRLSDPQGLGLVWRLKQNRLYALLSKLEREGYVEIEQLPQANRPDRKVFHLTDAGRQAFVAWMGRPVQRGRKVRLEFLAKLYFARKESRAAALKLVQMQQVVCRDWLASAQAKAAQVEAGPTYDWLVHQFRIGQMEAMLAWLEICQDEL